MTARPSRLLIGLSLLAGASAFVAALAGLLAPGTWTATAAVPFTTVAGSTVQLFGRGLYRHDGLLAASTYLGTDLVTVALMVPLLANGLARSARGSLHGRLLLAAALGFFAYNGAHLVFAVAFNPLFPVYVVVFGSSMLGCIVALTTIDLDSLAASTRGVVA